MTTLTLKNQPLSYTYKDLTLCFNEGIPLSCDQLNFIARHQKALSNATLDPIMKYYLNHYNRDSIKKPDLLPPRENLNYANVSELKKELEFLVKDTSVKLDFLMTPTQFSQLKFIAYGEIIIFHGNQLFTGAPFLHGGIPHLLYFRWGNLFCVAKFVVLPEAEKKALKSNVLIHVENINERLFIDCIYQYNHQNAKN